MGSRENPPYLSQRKLPPNNWGGARWEECTVDPPIHNEKGGREGDRTGRTELPAAPRCHLHSEYFRLLAGTGTGLNVSVILENPPSLRAGVQYAQFCPHLGPLHSSEKKMVSSFRADLGILALGYLDFRELFVDAIAIAQGKRRRLRQNRFS